MNTPAAPIDLLIEPRWVIPVEPDGIVLHDHALAVDQGRIVALLPAREAAGRFAPRERVSLPGHVLLPGFVNLHTHAAMALLRGYADDLPLMAWLQDRIWPAEGRHMSPRFVRDGTLLACWEMLRGGITCFNDMYFFPESAAESALEAGIRAVLGITVIEFPTAYATDADDYLTKGLAARDALRHEPLISFCMAPHAPYTVVDRTFERIATLAAQLDVPVHIHAHETLAEVEEGVRRHGVRPIERLHRLGLLGPGLIAVHAVHLLPEEIRLLGRHGCAVAHCPTSNMKLASGIPPVNNLLAAGVRVGLGTDGAASNNRLDMFREMRHAALLAKVASSDAAALDAHRALRMATLDGAAALGLDRDIGSIIPGKSADLCAVRLDDWLTQPCYDPASHLIYVAGRENVSHVWVAGKLRIRDGYPADPVHSRLLGLVNVWHTECQ
ncbi:MAG: TRZ/ATZ family hydrolase [Candidatus Nitricoxidivorans perseverans]|uniref:TRZ/ATZ family hydrolase n=1 Tax=Candidatus Nitricoxidivorans perseverans TaxID=2975601 RepID=A0AA49FLZ1_9PROT|nr:MAG: TRZ/ATZ family hydrolase [Candidatus Nitricoxidivorans perseverans]